jgi:hypothetical protein
MVTLSKRATPSQQRILRAVAGAVKNVADHHPEYCLTPKMGRSIAKRAAGTLSSQWDGVLAAALLSSDRAGASPVAAASPAASNGLTMPSKGRVSARSRRAPLRLLWKELAVKVGKAKREGNLERAQAFIEVLRRIAIF